ncbi:MAG: 3-phosphoshikimate 1-carboxyvinyltransferase, partial [Acidobacteriota bacterium]
MPAVDRGRESGFFSLFMSLMNNETRLRVAVAGSSRLRGEFSLPGDKSISHRSALFAALGEGRSEISNYSTARDCQSTLDCLAGLGVRIGRSASLVTVDGVGLEGLREAESMLDAGNSGSTIRMLAGILAGHPFTSRITGDESIQRRP